MQAYFNCRYNFLSYNNLYGLSFFFYICSGVDYNKNLLIQYRCLIDMPYMKKYDNIHALEFWLYPYIHLLCVIYDFCYIWFFVFLDHIRSKFWGLEIGLWLVQKMYLWNDKHDTVLYGFISSCRSMNGMNSIERSMWGVSMFRCINWRWM